MLLKNPLRTMRRQTVGLLAGAFLLGSGAAVAAVAIPHASSQSDASAEGARSTRGDGSSTAQSDAEVPAHQDFMPLTGPGGGPCINQKDVALDVLTADSKDNARPEVWPPDASKARIPITGASFCGGVNQPAIQMSGGFWIFYERGYPIEGRSDWLKALAAQSGGEVTSINGLEAYVSMSQDKSVLSQILLMVPNTDEIIRIQAPNAAAREQLVDVAMSIPAPGSTTAS